MNLDKKKKKMNGQGLKKKKERTLEGSPPGIFRLFFWPIKTEGMERKSKKRPVVKIPSFFVKIPWMG